MANSPFQKVKVSIPLTPSTGGTGVGSLNNKDVIIGNGTSNVTTVSPGPSGNVLVSDGTNWTSGAVSLGDQIVSYSKLATDLVSSVVISASDVDWSLGAVYTKTLTTDTTLTFSNYKLDKNIVLVISGNYTLSLPTTTILLGGIYYGSVLNYISLHCVDDTSSSEKVLVTISQSL
jgi:hypothetical protein